MRKINEDSTTSFNMNNNSNSSFTGFGSNSNTTMFNSNNSNFSNSNNNSINNGSTSAGGGSSNSNNSSQSSISNFILIPLLSLTIIFSIAYIILILIRPMFRVNKQNWFTINVCVTTVLLSVFMLLMSFTNIISGSSSLPCRIQRFLPEMAASQMMYSHAVVAFSRFLTIVYSNKRIFSSTLCILSFISFGWIFAFLVSLAYLFVDSFSCSGSKEPTFLPYYNLSVILIVPVMIVLISNIRILIYVRRSSQRVHAEGRGNNVSQARDIRLIKTMIITFTVFVSGWGPLFIEQTFSESISISSIADIVFQILPPLSMLCDVILLIYTNQPVRIYLWQLITRRQQILIPNNTLPNPAKAKTNVIQNH